MIKYSTVERYLSDGVVGLGHTFSEVSGLRGASRPGGRASLCYTTGQGWSWGQDVVHGFCCGLQEKHGMLYFHNIQYSILHVISGVKAKDQTLKL